MGTEAPGRLLLNPLAQIDAAIEAAEKCRRRQDLDPLFRAVSDTLDEYLRRLHGAESSWAHPGEFVRWLTERGIIPMDCGDLAAYHRSVVRAGERDAEQIVALTERAEAAESRVAVAEARMEPANLIARLLHGDPHQWGKRPCQTCRAVSSILGYPFGCSRLAQKAPEEARHGD